MVRVIVGATVLVAATLAQEPTTRPQFDVASIKPNHSGDPIMLFQPGPGGRFTATNSSLRLLIRFAYEIKPFQIVGEPNWVNSDRYDIAAKADGSPQMPGIRAMLQRVLEDRFRLRYHRETRQAEGYVLVVSKAGKLRESEPGDCPSILSAPASPSGVTDTPCGGLRNSPGHTSGTKLTSAELADALAFFVRRFVLDKTGLTGTYDVELQWMLDPNQSSTLPSDSDLPSVVADGPSIFTALHEQLGLKLQATKGPVEVLVIDHVERPTEN